MSEKIVSFDVFDTVLTRIVRTPRDVFLLLQKQITTALPSLPAYCIEAFWAERILSEFRARRRSEADDIGLQEIYAMLRERCKIDEDLTEKIMSLELQIEESVLYPVRDARALVEEARRGAQIAFITDTYFPEGFIRNVLSKYDLLRSDDHLYISGVLGLSKRSGGLFKHVMDDLHIRPDQLQHCGDNIVSDISIPSGLGIGIHPSVQIPSVFQKSRTIFAERGSYACDLISAWYKIGCRAR